MCQRTPMTLRKALVFYDLDTYCTESNPLPSLSRSTTFATLLRVKSPSTFFERFRSLFLKGWMARKREHVSARIGQYENPLCGNAVLDTARMGTSTSTLLDQPSLLFLNVQIELKVPFDTTSDSMPPLGVIGFTCYLNSVQYLWTIAALTVSTAKLDSLGGSHRSGLKYRRPTVILVQVPDNPPCPVQTVGLAALAILVSEGSRELAILALHLIPSSYSWKSDFSLNPESDD
ncbi:hypothetical protein OE88DRAFT_1668302 [Heliocybe sulcata]|uniref:Uncharacterized protein n=1 Tax=Heliocybe sulcata TaxID=5364 RepID=A0A5C3MN09_9AGAM|nr:hypothetical protein OE88DRAFT_1668302 [Heliocybe sulcata]